MISSPEQPAKHHLRVLFLSRYYYWGGKPYSGMLHLAMSPLGLAARGHKVRLICERRQGQIFDDDGLDVRAFSPPLSLDTADLYANLFLSRHPVLRSGLVRAGHVQFLASLWKHALDACRDWTPDIVYCQAEAPALVAAAVARRFGARLVVHVYGGGTVTLNQARDPRWRALRYLDFVCAYRVGADAYLVVDDGTGGDVLARELGAAPDKIFHWPIPVVPPSPAAKLPLRERLAIPTEAPLLLAAARMVPIKRMDLCLETSILALKRTPHAHAVLVGDGPERLVLERRADELPDELRRRIHFTGYLERETLSQLLQESDMFLTLQEVSVSGTNIRDAMLHGLCVVAVQRPDDVGLPKLIQDGKNGRILQESELPSAGNLVGALLADRARLRQLGEAARATASALFETWERHLDAEESLLFSLTSETPHP